MLMVSAVVVVLQLTCSVQSAEYGQGYHSIPLALNSHSQIQVVHVPSFSKPNPTYVDVDSQPSPIYMHFKSQSSPLFTKQTHLGAPGNVEKSQSQDEPHKLIHEVTKPVVQEVRETIIPYRKVIQLIKPVHEEVQTVVHKHKEHKPQYQEQGQQYQRPQYQRQVQQYSRYQPQQQQQNGY